VSHAVRIVLEVAAVGVGYILLTAAVVLRLNHARHTQTRKPRDP